MNKVISLFGGTGNLGGRIVKVLLQKEAAVKVIVRLNTEKQKVELLRQSGAQVIEIDIEDSSAIQKALAGTEVVVSALQGLGEVILTTQSTILEAAIKEGVHRFIPSDYSVDYTREEPGANRNFDLRREFFQHIDKSEIKPTSIFNGAFADILAYSVPFVDLKNKSIGYWDRPDWKVDITTMDDTAAFTAAVAMDESSPRKLNIASFQITPRELQALASNIFNTEFALVNLGTVENLAAENKKDRAADPKGENELYPRWQGSQYFQSMFTTHHEQLDNDRYPDLKWTSAREVFTAIKNNI